MQIFPKYIVSFIFVVALALTPIYIFESGNPQLSHYALLLMVLLCAFKTIKDKRTVAENMLFLFLLWVVLRQSVYILETQKINLIAPVLYTAFNVVVYYTITTYSKRNINEVYRFITIGLFAAIADSAIGVYLSYGSVVIESTKDIIRTSGTFNNPNQLAYFAVCAAGIASLLYASNAINIWVYVVFYLLTFFFAMQSLSKSGLLAMFLYLMILLPKNKLAAIAVALIAITAIVYITVSIDSMALTKYAFMSRLMNIGYDTDDTIEGRGMGILLDPGARIVVGYGEGYTILSDFGKEVHSTLGNILISYGIIGFILFGLYLVFLYRGVAKEYGVLAALALVLPPQIYGIAHNGLRFSIFWIYYALLLSAHKIPVNIHTTDTKRYSETSKKGLQASNVGCQM